MFLFYYTVLCCAERTYKCSRKFLYKNSKKYVIKHIFYLKILKKQLECVLTVLYKKLSAHIFPFLQGICKLIVCVLKIPKNYSSTVQYIYVPSCCSEFLSSGFAFAVIHPSFWASQSFPLPGV